MVPDRPGTTLVFICRPRRDRCFGEPRARSQTIDQMSTFFAIVNCVNPRKWLDCFFRRSCQNSQDESALSENESNLNSGRLEKSSSPEKMCRSRITGQRCEQTSPNEDCSLQEPVCDEAMSLPEIPKQNEEVGGKVT
ncbi:hypothetical protein KIN20_012363 [Parelaphostrongylus tenuis]|uniref:Uncharacterized protein n=1 Tax=Parelaphostrongylus tenuis TaxID=148309 RepID=A0AAD5QK98_PARTN|nr:hypothetical protein KIN20_012363 [Parelaphostrongylus tenuis]